MRIHGDTTSGNCLKIKYTADFLRMAYDWTTVSALDGETRTPAFLALNPMGQIPVLELADGRTLAQSNGIIRYLARIAGRSQTPGSGSEQSARGAALLPDDPWLQAKIDEWLFWEQYSHEPYIAVCRFHMLYLGKAKDQREPWRVERGEKALDLMEAHLTGPGAVPGRPRGSDPVAMPRSFFVGDDLTIADIALLAYTRVAHEGGFDLAGRPHVRAWIKRCEAKLNL